MEVDHYPNHSQLVERVVKLVTDMSYKVCGFATRDGLFKLVSLPVADTKADYIKTHL